MRYSGKVVGLCGGHQILGCMIHDTRGREKARAMLQAYEEPKLDEAVAEGLQDFIARREEQLPNSVN